MLNKNKIFKNVLDRCESRIDIAAKYLMGNEFSSDNYTFEYAVSDLLYDASIVKRALVNHNDDIKLLFENTKNITEHFDSKLWPRLTELHQNYFSKEEFERRFEIIGTSYEEDIDDPEIESILIDLFERKDKLDLFSEDNSFFNECLTSFYKNNSGEILNEYKKLKDDYTEMLKNSINNSDVIFHFATGIQSSIRQLNLIPNSASYSWWYSVNNLTEENIEMVLEEAIKKDNVLELMNTMVPDGFDEFRNTIPDTYAWMVENSPQSAAYLSIISQPAVEAYRDWSESVAKPTPSDHQILDNIFRNVPGIDNAIIEDLIDAVLLEDMDPEKKNNILATAYFIIGKSKEALKLLSNEE